MLRNASVPDSMSLVLSRIRLYSLKSSNKVYIRCYAQQKNLPKKKTAMVKKSKGPPEDQQALQRGGKNFIYKSLPPSSLQADIFQPRTPELNFPLFTPENISTSSVGTIVALREPSGTFNAFGLPRNILLDFRLLHKPCSVVREATLKVMNILDHAKDGDGQNSRVVITGDSGCGKSFILYQAVNYALQLGWIVLYIPRAISFLDSSTKYEYDSRTRTYHQPVASQQLLRRLLSVNNSSLKSLKIERPMEFGGLGRLPVGTPLVQLIEAGIKDSHISSDVLSAVLGQLEHQVDYPILLAIDDFQALYCTSAYRNPDYNRILSYHLSVPRLLLDYAGGLKSFRKGVVLGAISASDNRFQAPLELREALQLTGYELFGTYESRASALVRYASGLRPYHMPKKLSITEAMALFDLWSSHLALHTRVNDELFHSKFTESSANARQFVRGMLRTLET